MELLIKNATIVRADNKVSSTKKDILIKKGEIVSIGKKIDAPNAKVIESNNLHVSGGWMDIGTQIAEPGYEHRETLLTVAKAAAAGGFTSIACFPNTNPVVDNKSAVHFIKAKTSKEPVKFHPIAALSSKAEGTDITEMMDLQSNGAIAFSDGNVSLQNSGVLLRALQYVKAFDGVIIQKSIDNKIANGGQVHEGLMSIQLGLKGIPSIAETSSLQKDIELNRYAESNIVFHTISTEGSYKIIKAAKTNKEKVGATVSYLNLVRTDEVLSDFDSQYKTKPPLRSIKDQNALIKGIKDNTIDAICSNHVPLEEEKKKMEFSYADFGAIGLQTVFPACNTAIGDKVSIGILCDRLSTGPRKLLGLKPIKIAAGEKAELTLFDPDTEWVFTNENNFSKSKNSPFLNNSFKGKVVGIINGKKHFLS